MSVSSKFLWRIHLPATGLACLVSSFFYFNGLKYFPYFNPLSIPLYISELCEIHKMRLMFIRKGHNSTNHVVKFFYETVYYESRFRETV